MKIRGVVLVSVCLLAACLATSASGAARTPFKPGLYVGKTSQGEAVKVRLTVGGEPCEGKPCVFAPSSESEVNVTETCSGEGSTNEYLDLVGNLVTSSGRVHVTEDGFSKLVAVLKVSHHGTITGKLRATSKLEDGERCDSGNVTLRAKIGGTTR